MFKNLSDRLTGIFEKIKSKGSLKENDVEEALREVRIALLEADVELSVVKEFLEKAKSLKPIYTRTELSRPVYLYEDTEIQKLETFGEVHPPAIADLFLAIMNKTNQSEEGS